MIDRYKYRDPYEKRRTEIVKSIYKAIPFEKDWQAADFGSGIGFYADLIKSQVTKVICLDISQKNVEAIKSKGYTAICHDLNRELPFKDSEFDFVNALEVIEHLEDSLYFLKELRRVIKPHRYLLISTVNRSSPEGWNGRIIEKIKKKRWTGWEDSHKHLFTYSEFIDMVNKYFEILNVIGYYFGVKVFKRHFPPFLWRLSSSNKILRRFGFNITVLARRR